MEINHRDTEGTEGERKREQENRPQKHGEKRNGKRENKPQRHGGHRGGRRRLNMDSALK